MRQNSKIKNVGKKRSVLLFLFVVVVCSWFVLPKRGFAVSEMESYMVYSIGLLCERNGEKRLLRPGTWKRIRIVKEENGVYIMADDGQLYKPEKCRDVRYYYVAP